MPERIMLIDPRFISNLKKACGKDLSIDVVEQQLTLVRASQPFRSHPTHTYAQLTHGNGVLDWEECSPPVPGLTQRRRGRMAASTPMVPIVSFPTLKPSQITRFLENQDRRMTPSRGLLRIESDGSHPKLVPATMVDRGKALLLIHGTFSNSRNVVDGIQSTPDGQKMLKDALQHYSGHVYCFDHATLSVGPLLNAIDLQRAIVGSRAKIDILAHSRGGLVARWWCELFDPQVNRCRKAILVGTPLAGTSLAAPPNIRQFLKLVTNYGNAIGLTSQWAGSALPVLGMVGILIPILTSVTSLAASTPMADACLAMVPGLFGQSRVENNPELHRLFLSTTRASRYFAIRSDFQPTDPLWQFWKVFRKQRLARTLADVIFAGPNDLVVDTDSMDCLSPEERLDTNQILDFGKSTSVHHVNYFDQPESIQFLRQVLAIPTRSVRA